MPVSSARSTRHGFLLLACSALVISACSTQQTAHSGKSRSKEYFAESEYGVKASPRVSNLKSKLPRGGGREQLGKPYKVKGKWYYPQEDPDYRKSGTASWYGDAFHGRLTANGEVYDMTHLTAAHPTMPLPSYARVTNQKNGSSVIVRVNDRGPFAHGRIIDLSRQAAEMLDYTQTGIAKVDVEYLGRAPLHGQDDQFLMASYRPGNAAPDPSDGMPTGVMIAMAGPTPSSASASAVQFPGQPAAAALPATQPPVQASSPFAPGSDVVLPEIGPIAPERPGVGMASRPVRAEELAVLAYADERVKRASAVVDAFAEGALTPQAITSSWNRGSHADAGVAAREGEYVAVGTYGDLATAQAMARALDTAGTIRIETDQAEDSFSVTLRSDGRLGTDEMLRTAWAAGATDALAVRE